MSSAGGDGGGERARVKTGKGTRLIMEPPVTECAVEAELKDEIIKFRF